MINIKEIKGGAVWDCLLDKFDGKTIFHQYQWLEYFAQAFNLKLVLLGAYEQENNVGVFPFFVSQRSLIQTAGSPLRSGTPYLGPLVFNEYYDEFLRTLNQWFSNESFLKMNIVSPDSKHLNSFIRFGYDCKIRRTYMLDVSGTVEEMWGKLQSRARNMVRKAEKGGVTVFEVTDPKYFDAYEDMSKEVYAKAGRSPDLTKSFFKGMWDRCHSKNMKVFFAEYDKKPIAAAVFVYWGDMAYYLDGVSLPAYNKYAANSAIQWEAIKWMTGAGFKKYNMVGANIPSIAKFKESFGPKMEEYFAACKYKNAFYLYGEKALFCFLGIMSFLKKGLLGYLFRRNKSD